MVALEAIPRRVRLGFAGLACGLTVLLVSSNEEASGQKRPDVLRIGTSTGMTGENQGKKEEAALDSLKAFIKEETGLNSEILRYKGWNEVADKMSKGELHIGVFQGYEYAWAQEKYAELHPLALAINTHRYPIAYVVVNKDNKAKDFAGLEGQSIAVPDLAQPCLRFYLERQTGSKKPEKFFSKIETPKDYETAFFDVVDGKVQAVVADGAALEMFKRRRPGEFPKLKEVAASPPFPPPTLAYFDKVLDDATLKQFKDGILNSGNKAKGQQMLELFRLTGFESAPADFGKVLAETRKAFPPLEGK